MIFYCFFWFLIILFSSMSLHKGYNTLSYIFIFIIMLFFIGFRPISLGTDTMEYYNIYERYSDLYGGLEYVFSFIIIAFKSVGLSPYYWMAFLFVIFIFPLIYVFYRVYESSFYLLMIISNLTFWLYSINIVRQGLAFSFYILAVYLFLFRGKKTYKSIAIVFLALGFHISILIPIIFLFVYSERISFLLIRFFWIFILIPVFFVIFDFDLIRYLYIIIGVFDGVLPERFLLRFNMYYDLFESGELKVGFSYFFSLLFLVLSWFVRGKIFILSSYIRYKIFLYSFFSVFIYIVLYPVFYKYEVFARVLSYFDFFVILIICEIIIVTFNKKSSFVAVVFVATLLFGKVVFTGYNYGFLSDRFLYENSNHRYGI